MASSTTEICNLALSHAGVGKEISNVDTERSSEALACKRFYDTALVQVFRDYPWSFADAYATLGLVQENPNTEYGFSYRWPSDCISALRILSGIRNDYRESRVTFKIGQDADGILIFTDKEDAVLEYTAKITDPTKYPGDFTMALSLRLAALIAPRITGGDPFKLKAALMQEYMDAISNAKSNAANEDQPDPDPDGEFIRGRI